MDKIKRDSKKALTAVVGFAVLIAGIVMIPYPGPGWLVVFAGLAILAREFTWAQAALDYAKSRYDAWQAWVKSKGRLFQLLLLATTGLVVVVTLWIVNAYGIINNWLGLGIDWLNSPFVR